MTVPEQTRAHHLRTMSGRDPDERHRAATPLELLYALTFVVAFGVASEQFAHLLAEGHLGAGLAAFGVATFTICWAWINYSWFASAYDTGDWVFRLATMVQMVGVIILALGLPQVFGSIDQGEPVDDGVTVAGYVVMRVAMVFLWVRAARQDPLRRRVCQTYAVAIGIAQLGWVLLLILAEPTVGEFFVWASLLLLIEIAGPIIAERRKGGTPWHAHHIAERYGLLTIITLRRCDRHRRVAQRGGRIAGLESGRRTCRGRWHWTDLLAVVDLFHGSGGRGAASAPRAWAPLGI
jgi:low temperature requirement protein LtrA